MTLIRSHKISRIDRRAILIGGFASASGVSYAFAAHKQIFSANEFTAALARGWPILVEVTAASCPTCRMQSQAVGVAINQPRFSSFTTFVIDFDTQREAAASLRATVQSTLIVFKNGEEVGRSVGEAKRERIEALLARAL